MHTAVKIEQLYKGNQAVHVLDASRAVVVCQQLLDKANNHEYKADVAKEYEVLRAQYLAS